MTYPHPCNRCGFCCVVAPCPAELHLFGPRAPGATCPALSFNGTESTCALVAKVGPEVMGIGVGCCIKATAFVKGQPIDFASMPGEMKILATQQAQRQRRSQGNN
jgi:hypothetical protein